MILASKLGYQTQSFADAAKKLGVEVAFGTDRCHKLDDPWGDGALALRFENLREAAEEIVREGANRAFATILALGDRPTVTAAYAARALGLKGNPPAAVEICRNKLRQREEFARAGLRVPRFSDFALDEEIVRVLDRVAFPCVVKPLALAASQGVIRANDAAEFRVAVDRVRALFNLPEIAATRDAALGRVLVEEYIPGGEVAVEGLMTESRLRILTIFDKADALEGPFFEETIYVTPSRFPQQVQNEVAECAAKAAEAIGLIHGPIHAEFRINEAGVWPLEVAPRPIGGLCSRALRFGESKISLEELILRHALELGGSDAGREARASGVMMIPVPRSGMFAGVEGIDAARNVAGIDSIEITARVHDYIAAWPEGSSYLGFIFSHGETPQQAERALRTSHAKLKFAIAARLPVEHPATRKITA